MKPVYKCDYCSFMGTEEETKEHELTCIYGQRSCYTCKHKRTLSFTKDCVKYKCEKGRDIPEGMIFKFCDLYEQNDYSKAINDTDIFGSFF